MRAGARRAGRAIVALALVIAAPACRSDDTESRRRPRLIENDPPAVTSAPAWRMEAVAGEAGSAGFGISAAGAGCVLERLGEDHVVDCGDRTQVAFSFGGEVPAEEVEALVVTLAGVDRQPVTLRWRDAAGGTHEVTDLEGRPKGDKIDDHRFPLAGLAGWSGRVSGLELHCDRVPSGRVEVRDIRRATLLGTDPGAYPRQARLELDRDWRVALVLLPGQSEIWAAGAPQGPVELRFAFGVESRLPPSTRFRVTVERRNGTEELFSREAEQVGVWRTAAVRYESSGAADERLRFEVTGERGGDGRLGAAAFAHPEVVTGVADERPNVVLLVVDTLRADRLSAYGYGRPTSPRLDAWIERRGGAIFRRAIAQAPWTLPAHASLFSGENAQNHGATSRLPVPEELELMAERFRASGYSTCAVTGGGFVHPFFGFAAGFDRYAYHSIAGTGPTDLLQGLKRAERCLDELAPPYLLFFHTYEVHHPYLARAPYFQRWSRFPPGLSLKIGRPERIAAEGFLESPTVVPGSAETDRLTEADRIELLGDLYDSGIAFTDEKLGALFERLDSEDTRRPTWVVFTSDHGEALGEHGRTNHSSLDAGVVRIPLIVVPPARQRAAALGIDRQVRQVDLLPTALGWIGERPRAGIDGISLSPLMTGSDDGPRDAWSYVPTTGYGIALTRADGWRLTRRDLIWAGTEPWERLFQIEVDPTESRDALAAEPQIARALRGELDRELVRARHGLFFEAGGELPGWEVELLVPGASAEDFKAVDGPDATAKLVSGDRIRAGVGPDKKFRLFVTGAPDGAYEFDVPAIAGSTPVAAAHFAVPAMDLVAGPRTFSVSGGVWTAADRPGASAWLRLELRGRARKGADGPAVDDALREELRALGYLR